MFTTEDQNKALSIIRYCGKTAKIKISKIDAEKMEKLMQKTKAKKRPGGPFMLESYPV